jgi:aconitase B
MIIRATCVVEMNQTPMLHPIKSEISLVKYMLNGKHNRNSQTVKHILHHLGTDLIIVLIDCSADLSYCLF